MPSGFNWRNNLSQFASISGVLAGFSVTFIALILGGTKYEISLYPSLGISYSTIAILCFGIASVLFITAAEHFLHASDFDLYNMPECYRDLFKKECEEVTKRPWEDWKEEQTAKCRNNEEKGRKCYNFAIILLCGGLFYAISPYSFFSGIIVFSIGIFFQFKEEIVGKVFKRKSQNQET